MDRGSVDRDYSITENSNPVCSVQRTRPGLNQGESMKNPLQRNGYSTTHSDQFSFEKRQPGLCTDARPCASQDDRRSEGFACQRNPGRHRYSSLS